MKVTTDTNLIFDTADENCKLIIANDRATVVCIDGKSKKKRYNEYWIPLTGSPSKPYCHRNFESYLEINGLKNAIAITMGCGSESNEYLNQIGSVK